MRMRKIAVALVLVTLLPSSAAAQLSANERYKAEQVARIQAEVMAEEQATQRRSRLDSGKSLCPSMRRGWDDANESRYYRRSQR